MKKIGCQSRHDIPALAEHFEWPGERHWTLSKPQSSIRVALPQYGSKDILAREEVQIAYT